MAKKEKSAAQKAPDIAMPAENKQPKAVSNLYPRMGGKTAEMKQAKSSDDIYNVLASAFEGQSSTPLYDRLVAGGFNGLQWEQFADMCGRIVREENVPWTELHKYISAYVEENEPEGGYNYAAGMKPQESNWNTGLYRIVRKALKNMPLDEEERRAFEQWRSSDSQAGR